MIVNINKYNQYILQQSSFYFLGYEIKGFI